MSCWDWGLRTWSSPPLSLNTCVLQVHFLRIICFHFFSLFYLNIHFFVFFISYCFFYLFLILYSCVYLHNHPPNIASYSFVIIHIHSCQLPHYYLNIYRIIIKLHLFNYLTQCCCCVLLLCNDWTSLVVVPLIWPRFIRIRNCDNNPNAFLAQSVSNACCWGRPRKMHGLAMQLEHGVYP